MIRTSWAPAFLIALSSAVLPAGPAAAQSPHTHEHSFSDARNWAQVFDDPKRDATQKPHEIIMALALKPTLLLLDEPTANLDGDARKQVLELVTALCIENHTVVVASHDPEIIRLAILNRVHVADGHIKSDD